VDLLTGCYPIITPTSIIIIIIISRSIVIILITITNITSAKELNVFTWFVRLLVGLRENNSSDFHKSRSKGVTRATEELIRFQ